MNQVCSGQHDAHKSFAVNIFAFRGTRARIERSSIMRCSSKGVVFEQLARLQRQSSKA